MLSGLIMYVNRGHILFQYQKAQMPSVSDEIIQIFVCLQKEKAILLNSYFKQSLKFPSVLVKI